jgi:hypothetical protein
VRHTVLRGLSVNSLRASVPRRYCSQLPDSLSEQSYTLVLFRSAREDVVLSSVVASALADVNDMVGTVVAVGGGFTVEGLALLRARKCIILTLSDFYWTDESYLRQRHSS